MRNIYLSQVNDVFGHSHYALLPLAAALLWTYSMEDKLINKSFMLRRLFFLKQPLENVIRNLEEPSVFGFSSYMWNWEYNKALAREVKKRYPSCLIIFGGPHVPENDPRFFHKYPFIDILVHGEGEATFKDILIRLLDESTSLSGIPGATVKISNGDPVKGPKREKIQNLDSIPSPYLAGIFDTLIENNNISFSASMQHARGCPFSCNFCNVGRDQSKKIREFNLDRIKAEIDWISDHKIDYISNADSNFGILDSDMEIARYLVKRNCECGYPRKFRTDWAHFKTQRIMTMVKMLEDAGMNKGITIACQSMDKDVQRKIHRHNMKEELLSDSLKQFTAEGIKTYSELILGLPGETYDGFITGLCSQIEAGQHNCINVYPLMVLPNTDYAKKHYQKQNGIKTWTSPQANFFVSDETRGEIVNEYEECVYETRTLGFKDWEKAYLFYIVTSWGHFLSFTYIISRFFRKSISLSYRAFYESLLDWSFSDSNSVLGKEMAITKKALRGTCEMSEYRGRTIDGIYWDFDQALGINSIEKKERLYTELSDFILGISKIDREMLDELIKFQKFFVIDYYSSYPVTGNFKFGIYDYIENPAIDRMPTGNIVYSFHSRAGYKNRMEFSRDVFWFNRRMGACKAFVRREHRMRREKENK